MSSIYEIRSSHVPDRYQRLPEGVTPIKLSLSPWGLSALLTVIGAYRPQRYREIDFEKLTLSEKWLCSSSRWVRVGHTVRTLLGDNFPKRTRGCDITACLPAGCELEHDRKPYDSDCRFPVCVHCHARTVSRLYSGLELARSRRPEGSEFYVGFQYFKETKSESAAGWFRKNRSAGGVAFRYLRYSPNGYYWVCGILAVSDCRKTLMGSGLRGVRRVKGAYHLAGLASRWLRYPPSWDTSRPTATISDLIQAYEEFGRSGKNYWHSRVFGACTENDYTPGKSWCDFTGYEKGGVRPPERVRDEE